MARSGLGAIINMTKWVMEKIPKQISRRIFTATEPILWLAASNDNAVTGQKKAVINAANSPR